MSEARRLFMTADLDPHDTTLHVHAEALREIEKEKNNDSAPEEEDINFRQINEKIYYLLIKNVSRDSPLTSEEVQYLRSFRSSMSGEQWQRWLSYARSERKRLKDAGEIDRFMRKHQGYPDDDHSERSSRVVPTTMSLAEAIDASNSRDDNNSPQDDHSYSSRPAPQPTSDDASRRRSLFHMTSVPVNVAETTIGEPVELSPRRRNFTPTLGQPKEHSQPVPMPSHSSSSTSYLGRKPVPERNAMSPGRVNVNVTIPRPQYEDVILSTPAPKPVLNDNSSTAKGTPNRYSVLETTPAMLSARSSSQTTMTIDDGFSTVKPIGLRAHSAPRLRPTMPSNLAVTNTPAVNPPGGIPMPGESSHMQSGRKTTTTTSPPRFTSRIIEDASLPKPPPPSSMTTTTTWATAASHSNPHHVAAQSQAAFAPSAPFLASPGKAVAAYVTKQQQQQQQQQLQYQMQQQERYSGGEDDMYAMLHRTGRRPLPPSAAAAVGGGGGEREASHESKRSTTPAPLPAKRPEAHTAAAATAAASISSQMLDDLRETLESAQMGTSRIENACTAARFLISSLGALSQQVDPNTNQNLENSRQVLEEMLRSLEKSKNNFGRIEDTVHKNLKVEDLHHPPSSRAYDRHRGGDGDGGSQAAHPHHRPPPASSSTANGGRPLVDEEYEVDRRGGGRGDRESTHHDTDRDRRAARHDQNPPTHRHHHHQQQHQSSSYDDDADQRSVPTTHDDHLPSDDYLRFQPLADDIHSMQHTQTQTQTHQFSASSAAPVHTAAFQSYRGHHHHHDQQQPHGGQVHQFQSSLLRRTAATADMEQPVDDEGGDNDDDPREMDSVGGRSSSNYPAQLMWSPAKSFRGGQRVLVEDHSAVAVMTEGRNQAQNTWGLVTRVCINRGPLVKAYEEFPIRLDAEAMSVDIVWRESRVDLIRGTSLSGVGGAGGAGGGSSRPRSSSVGRHMRPTASSAAGAAINYYQPMGGSGSDLYDMESQRILRRERFQFDAMYIGPTADRKLQEYVRYRTRAALHQGTNLVFLCNACGESAMGELEAPVTVALGSGGGSGIATNILLEAFKVVAANNAQSVDSRNGGGGTDSYILRSAVQTQYASTRMAQDNRSSSISLTAVLLNGSTMVDMLSNAAQQGRHGHQPRIQRRGGAHGGEVTLQGVTTLDLSNVMDFERIIGLLLGRRTGINETMQSLHLSSSEYPDHHNTPLSSYATWTTQSVNPATERLRRLDLVNDFTSSSASASSTRTAAPNVEAPSSSSTMVLSFRITLGSSLMPKRVLHIRVVCPCGKDWTSPNFDLSVLSESIGALPHTPPEGLLAVSPLSLLLTDVSQQPSNFVSVVHVNRVDSKRQHQRIPQSDQEIAVAALNSMRVSCLAR